MTPPIPSWPYFVDSYPTIFYPSGRKDPEPIALHVVLDNRGLEPTPAAFAYSRHDAKLIAIALSEHEDKRQGIGVEE